jgi:hypothetical protein
MGNIIWLASYPKSGNTWLRAFLANLYADRGEAVPLNELSRYCDDDSLPERYSELAGQPSATLDFTTISRLRPQVHALIAEATDRSVFVKTHNMSGSSEGYPLHNPDVGAAAIYVVRNPLDIAISMTHNFGLSADEAIDYLGNEGVATENDALHVSQLLGSWSQHVASWTSEPAPRLLVLRYEDLLEKPAKSFGKVANLVAQGIDRARVERAIRNSGFQSLAMLERRDGFVERSAKAKHFFRVGRAGQWRTVLTRAQIQRVIADHREQMGRFKYIPPGY